jgi:hypothetical protein
VRREVRKCQRMISRDRILLDGISEDRRTLVRQLLRLPTADSIILQDHLTSTLFLPTF